MEDQERDREKKFDIINRINNILFYRFNGAWFYYCLIIVSHC